MSTVYPSVHVSLHLHWSSGWGPGWEVEYLGLRLGSMHHIEPLGPTGALAVSAFVGF